jgi:hypothetical protein
MKKNELQVGIKIEDLINNFTRNIECFPSTLSKVIRPIVEDYKKSDSNVREFLKTKAKKLKRKRFSIQFENSQQFDGLLKERNGFMIAFKTIPRALFISLISYFDNYLQDLIRVVFERNFQLLNTTEKKISVSEILDFSDSADLKTYIIGREVDQLTQEGRFKCIETLAEKLKVDFSFEEGLKKKFIEITERRNLFVHSDGVVTNRYLSTCKKYGIEINRETKVGTRLNLNPKYFFQACYIVHAVGVQVGQVVWRKLEPENLENIDSSLLNMTADLLNERNNYLAGKLLDFANRLKKFSSEKMKLMFLINRALAMKFGGAPNQAYGIIRKHDWSAAEGDLKLAIAIIKNKEKEAAKIMLKIGNTEEMMFAYRSWPLFIEFRNSELFRKTYEKIFGESFIIESKDFLQNIKPQEVKEESINKLIS